MNSTRARYILFLAVACFLSTVCYGGESTIVLRFEKALEEDDSAAITALIEENRERISGEIGALLDEALLPETTGEEKEGLFYLAEWMARSYMEVTGDVEMLKGVKKRIFESKISTPVRTVSDHGLHIVEATSTEEVRNIFMPDNIVIKKGETVRWVNSDNVDHLVGSVPFIGRGGIMTPRIKPGESMEYRFEEAGDYYYVCFIHRVMYGKVTVEEKEEDRAAPLSDTVPEGGD